MIAKVIVIILIILMIIVLGMALKQLLSSNKDPKKLISALSWRIAIWVLLLFFIILAVQLKWLYPSESLIPKSTPTSESAN